HQRLPGCPPRPGIERDLDVADQLKVVLKIETLMRPLFGRFAKLPSRPLRPVEHQIDNVRMAGSKTRRGEQVVALARLLEKLWQPLRQFAKPAEEGERTEGVDVHGVELP